MFQNEIDGFLFFAVNGQDLTDFAHFFASGKPALHRQGLAKKFQFSQPFVFLTQKAHQCGTQI